jgi:hypothetical protein
VYWHLLEKRAEATMTRNWFKTGTCVMWLALPITALNYWSAWDQLPARMAVHFDASWRPNGYTSREGALLTGLGLMAVMLVVFTVGALLAHAMKPAAASWMLLLVFYVALGFTWYGNYSIIEFNRGAQPVRSQTTTLKVDGLTSCDLAR